VKTVAHLAPPSLPPPLREKKWPWIFERPRKIKKIYLDPWRNRPFGVIKFLKKYVL